MNVMILGATGMVGQGVLRECLLDERIRRVVTLGRSATGQQHAKLTEIVHADLFDLSAIERELGGIDACFFCLGVSSFRMSETHYSRVTLDLTIGVARTLARLNPGMRFSYVSGAGTDSTERGKSMWARVKGRTENALLAMPFGGAYMFRPGAIVAMDGIRSRTALYRVLYAVGGPLWPILQRMFPGSIVTTRELGRAMIDISIERRKSGVIEVSDIAAFRART